MKAWIIAAAVVALSAPVCAQRETVSLDGPWKFLIDSANTGVPAAWFRRGLPAAGSRPVDVPHTWNMDAGHEEYGGAGWYERTMIVPDSWNGRFIRLRFEGVYHTATVWINGRLAGEHRGTGYTPFTLDCTQLLRPGSENAVVVRVDNAFSRQAIPFFRSFDWPKDGGILRPVALIATGRPAIGGVHVDAVPLPQSTGTSGTLHVAVRLMERSKIDLSRLRCAVAVHGSRPDVPVVTGLYRPEITGDIATLRLTMDSVRVWRCDDPALYRLSVTLTMDGTPTDSVSTTFGFREIRTQGPQLLMNGDTVRLMGVEWMPGSSLKHGMAESRPEAELMLSRLRSVNAIFTRFHWQQAEHVLDWCDRHGILVQEEIPLWGMGVPLNDTVMALARSQLSEMIEAHYNHPSVAMWGVGNELASTRKSIIDSVRALYAYAKRLDPRRLVNYVSNRLSLGEGRDASGEGDIIMWNEYQDTWYLGDPAGIRSILDTIHAAYPEKPVVVSEYGLCEPANQGGDERRVRDLLYHTAVLENTPFVAGAIYFCLNDYRTHMGEEGTGALRRRVHGVFDLEGRPKPSAATLAALCSPVEILNVGWKTGHRFEVAVIASRGLPSHPLRGYTLYWSPAGSDFRSRAISVQIPDLRPGEKLHVPLDADLGTAVDVTIVRPSGEVVARRTYDIPK